ncbi:MAG: protein translocase subunit SecF [Myxococcota bacterium]
MAKIKTPPRDFDFMGLRRYFIGLSAVLAVLSIVGFFYPGPRFGTDFRGGTELEVAFQRDISPADIRAAVVESGFSSPDVVAVDSDDHPNQYLIRVKEVTALTDAQKEGIRKALCLVPEDQGADAAGGPADGAAKAAFDEAACPPERRTTEVKFSPGGDKVAARFQQDVCGEATPEVKCPPRSDIAQQLVDAVEGVELRPGANNPVVQNQRDHRVEFFFKSKGDQLMDNMRERLGTDVVPERALRVEWIGAKASGDLRDAAIKSITIAIVFIMLYIAFRFDMRFAPGAIAALIHDVFLAVGAMVLFQREFTLSSVAAILTIVGYSINDTVVVYDRIRENLGKYRKMTFPKIINRSITEMLGRTIRTSGLTGVAMFPFLFFGSGVIRDFAFTLLVGVIVGTYSSIYVAAPLTEIIDRKVFGTAVKKKRRIKRRKKGAAAVAASV